jgi:glycosyltransferase involved in cell wall biosynthesis
MKLERILIISHDGTLTGAPKLLLNLIKLLKHQGIEIHTLIKNGFGELIEDFKAESVKFAIYPSPPVHGIRQKVKNIFRGKSNSNNLSPFFADLSCVINNTITNGEILETIRRMYNGPIITYIHELEIATLSFTNAAAVKETIQNSDYFFVPSQVVKSYLTTKLSIPENRISLLNYFIATPAYSVPIDRTLETSKPGLLVGGCGTTDWRKGADIFIHVANYVYIHYPNLQVSFKWKGAQKASLEFQKLQYDLQKMQIINKVEFIEVSDNTEDLYREIDLFLLTSREDPYPLVVLEAASYNVPTICFYGAGGAPEFVQEDAGDVVPYLSIESMGECIVKYAMNPELAVLKGAAAKQKLKERHQSPDLIRDQLNSGYKNAWALRHAVEAPL